MTKRDNKPNKTTPQPVPAPDKEVSINESITIGDKSTRTENFVARVQPRRNDDNGSSSGGGKGKG